MFARSLFLLICLALPAMAQPAKPPVPSSIPPDLTDWTPRPATGKAEPWEKMTDKDWTDPRFRQMNTGPALNATFRIPTSSGSILVYKGLAIQFSGKPGATVVFDRATGRWAAGWFGSLQHSDRRFGLLNTPTPAANSLIIFTSAESAGWANPQGQWEAIKRPTAPMANYQFLGHMLHKDRVVVQYLVNGVRVHDTMKPVERDGQRGFLRTVSIDAHDQPLTARVDGGLSTTFPKSAKTESFFIKYGADLKADADDLTELGKPGPSRWGKPIITQLEVGSEDGPFAIDTLTIPHENPFKSLFFCTGLDFLPDGRVAMSTCHGDVWVVAVDERAKTCSWQRFATGLYHPLGLKVVAGKVVVLERGQLTRLHDLNDDGEADRYECISNNWHTGAGEHAYDTCLETDPQGNFYFFKTGDTELPSGGTLIRVSADGQKVETFATGFRHPIGMGMSPGGIVTGADQEGNWMPATRVDQYKLGGFYGDMRANHRATPPRIYDGPLCWLPREVDNSAGGQVWVPQQTKTWKSLAGLPLHLSYGRCKAFVLFRQEFPDGTVQGGVADLGLRFLSGSCRARFHPREDQLYVCGLNGWQTAAKADGSLQRVRATGKPLDVPVKMEAVTGGVKLTFSRALNKETAENPANYRAAWWNYRWSGDYGSKRWKVSNPNAEGQDDVPVKAAKLLDEKTVFVQIEGMKPVMQMQLGHNLTAADGAKVVGSVYLTIHQLAKE